MGLNKDRQDNPIYKNKGFFGFGALASGDCSGVTLTDVQFKSDGTGTCSISGKTTKKTCKDGSGIWTSSRGTEWDGSDPSACTLGNNEFKMGAYTDVSKLDTFLTASQDGKISEQGGTLDCL